MKLGWATQKTSSPKEKAPSVSWHWAHLIVPTLPKWNPILPEGQKAQKPSALAHSRQDRRFRAVARLFGLSQSGHVCESDNHQATNQDLLVGLMPLRNRRFSLSGRAWSMRIPDSSPVCGLDISNNVPWSLGMMVTIWLVLIKCGETRSKQDCILALGNNTSAIGWLFESGKLDCDSPCAARQSR